MSGKSLVLDRHVPARDLAARAASKHGNPAEHAVYRANFVRGDAAAVAARLTLAGHALAATFDDLAVGFARDAEAGLDRGSFRLWFRPRDTQSTLPVFDGQLRVDPVDHRTSRVVLTGRYAAPPTMPLDAARAAAEAAAARIVDRLAALSAGG